MTMNSKPFNSKLEQILKNSDAKNEAPRDDKKIPKQSNINKTELHEKAEVFLKNILSEVIKLTPEKFRSQDSFEKYGIDSLMIVNLNRKLEQIFGDLPKTLFFEYQTFQAL